MVLATSLARTQEPANKEKENKDCGLNRVFDTCSPELNLNCIAVARLS